MRKALKELVESAEVYNSQPLDYLLIIPSGEAYNGFWDKNNFNKIILLGGRCKDEKVYRIDTKIQHDVVSFREMRGTNINIDIPQEYNCVRLIFNKCVIIENFTSNLMIREV